MTLGERLLKYRTNAKMSQDTLAEKVGVTRQTVSKWETDQSTPEFNKILPLCEVFEITTDELIKGGEDVEEQMMQENDAEQGKQIKETEKISLEDNKERNRKKAIAISSSAFFYILGMFLTPYMIQSLHYSDAEVILGLGIMWGIASIILIYFFTANPKENKKIKVSLYQNTEKTKAIERTIIYIISLVFLCIYLWISFVTNAWGITWVIWLIYGIVRLIMNLITELNGKKEEKNEE